MSNYYKAPSVPINIPLRPLNKGMLKDVPSNLIPTGGFLNIDSLYVYPEGLQRRDGLSKFIADVVDYPPIQETQVVWSSSGTQFVIVIDSKFLYVANIAGYTVYYHKFEDALHTVTVSDTAISASNTAWNSEDIKAGDIIAIDTSAGGDWSSEETAEISSIDSNESITLESADLTDGSGLKYEIRKAFHLTGDKKIDTAWADNKIIIADGYRPLRTFDGIELEYLDEVAGNISGTFLSTNWDTTNNVVDLDSNPSDGQMIKLTTIPAGLEGLDAYYEYYLGLYSGTEYYFYDTEENAITNDGSTGLQALSGTVTTSCLYNSIIKDETVPDCVTHFQDRLFVFRLQWESEDLRSGIGWSKITDKTKIIDNGEEGLLLPYSPGRGRRLLALGNLLIAYLTDRVYLGRRTNVMGDTLPVSFEVLETGGRGLAGPRAVCSHLDSHYFIGPDDIYQLSPSYGIKPLGGALVKDILKGNKYLSASYVIPDPLHERIVFGIPTESAATISKLFNYYYRTGAWSVESVSCDTLNVLDAGFFLSWDDSGSIVSTWDSEAAETYTWDTLRLKEEPTLFLCKDDTLYKYDSSLNTDAPTTSSIPVELITGDFDFNAPDKQKTFIRLSLKLEDIVSSKLTFTVTGSINRGNTYKSLGNLIIKEGYDEGFVNFRITGSICRFKLISTSVTNAYTITELVFKVKGRGMESIHA